MNTEITENIVDPAGWLFYDGECPLCCESARRFARILARRKFGLRPLQSPGVAQRLGLDDRDLLLEMRLLLADGRSLGGADAVVEIARHIWWAWPLWLISRLPGARRILRAAYRRIAANRHCVAEVCGPMSASSFRPFIAVLEGVKRLRFAGGKQFRAPRKGQTTPPQLGKPRHRHSAFFELP